MWMRAIGPASSRAASNSAKKARSVAPSRHCTISQPSSLPPPGLAANTGSPVATVGPKIESLRRARAVVDALDAAVDQQPAAEGEITDGVLLQRGARIDHRKFVRAAVDNLLAQCFGAQIDAIAAQLAGRLGGSQFALHQPVEQGIVRREMVGRIIADEIGDDIAVLFIALSACQMNAAGASRRSGSPSPLRD